MLLCIYIGNSISLLSIYWLFKTHTYTAVCVIGKKGTDSSSSSVSCVSISNRPSFRIRFIFIIISLAIFLRPNAQLSADPRITLWCFCERVRYTHPHDYGGWRESPMVQTSHRTYAARTYLLEHFIARIHFDKASLQFQRTSNALASSNFDVFATRIWLQFISSPTYIYWFYFIILPTTRTTCSHACAWHPWHTNHPQRSTNQMPLNYKNPNR